MNVKALLIIGLFVINDACADFTIEAKCLKDERTGITLTYDDSGKPIVVKKCKNPVSTKLFYWRIRQAIPTKNGEIKSNATCFLSGNSPMESLNIPITPCSLVKDYVVDIYNLD